MQKRQGKTTCDGYETSYPIFDLVVLWVLLPYVVYEMDETSLFLNCHAYARLLFSAELKRVEHRNESTTINTECVHILLLACYCSVYVHKITLDSDPNP